MPGAAGCCAQLLIELLNLVAQSVVFLNQPGQLSVNKIKKLVHFILVIPRLAHRRLTENDITNLSRTQRHRSTSGLFSTTISTRVPTRPLRHPHHGLSDNEHHRFGKPGGIQEPFAHPSPPSRTPMTMDRSAPGPSVGRLSGRNDAQQRDVTPTNEKYFRWSASLSWLWSGCLLGLPKDVVHLVVHEGVTNADPCRLTYGEGGRDRWRRPPRISAARRSDSPTHAA
jgi:hypothetical protein